MSAEDAKAYYMGAKSHARMDYYHEHESRGMWFGKGARHLRLSGTVEKDPFCSLCDNLDPRTGKPLTGRTRQHRRVGFDISFNAPKSLSVLWAYTQDPRVIEALREAAHATLADMERKAAVRIRKEDQDRDEITGNWAGASFVHHTSRPSKDSIIPDVNLHLHAFVFNASYSSVEKKWKALQPGLVHQDAPYYQQLFHSHLANAISKLGYAVDRRGAMGWEVAAVQRPTIETFSKRTHEIESVAKALGITDPDRKSELGARTRQHKNKKFSLEELRNLWLEQLDPAEVRRLERAQKLYGAEPVTADHALDHAYTHVFERDAVARDQAVFIEAMRRGMGALEPEQILKTFRGLVDQNQVLTHIDETGRRWITTPALLEEERELLRFAREGRGRHAPLGDPDRIIGQQSDVELNVEQQLAVRHLWSSFDRVMAIRGAAGVGKTTLFKEAVMGIEANGRKVIALAPSAQASRGVLRNEGFAGAETVAKFLQNAKLHQQARGQVIWVDEASLLGTREVHRLFKLADKLKARVILSGDYKQHRSVSRGTDLFKLLDENAGIKPVEVTEIVRQRGAYKKVVESLSKGEVEKGFRGLDCMGAIIEVEDGKHHELVAADYVQAIGRGKSALIVTPTHAEAGKVTEHVRHNLKALGTLKGKEKAVTHQRNLHWTDAQKRNTEQYEKGMCIYFHKALPGVKPGSWFVVHSVTTGQVILRGQSGASKLLPLRLPKNKTDRFSVYKSQEIGLIKGDLVRFTQNTRTVDGKSRINNGTTYRLRRFTVDGAMLLEPVKKTKSWRPAKALKVGLDNGLFTHGYCSTSHSSQGKTVDRVFIAQGSESVAASSIEQFYVSVSRGRQEARVYTDSKRDLLKAIQRSEHRPSATELARQRYGSHRHQQARRLRTLFFGRAMQRKAHELRLALRQRYELARQRTRQPIRGMGHERER